MRLAILSHFKLLLVLLVLCTTGCAAQTEQYKAMLDAGQAYEAAAIVKDGAESDDILETLHYAYALRCDGRYPESTQAFDRAEALFKATQEDQILHEASKLISASFINENITAYTGNLYEFTLVNTYKGINFLLEKQPGSARVEFNRALDRQRRAKEYFNKELQEEISKIKEQTEYSPNPGISALDIASNPTLQTIVGAHYSNMNAFTVFANYTNPFITYFAGIFFMLDGDYKKAVDILKEAAAMCPHNNAVQADFSDVLTTVRNGIKQNQKFVWVFFENGTGPGLEPLQFNVPLFFATNKALVASIALPRPTEGIPAIKNLHISTKEGGVNTELLADMTQIVYTEFKSRFNTILLRAVTGMLAKVAMQVSFAELGGDAGAIGQLASAFYSILATSADTRHWVSLPARFEIARIRIDNTDGKVTLSPLGFQERTLDLDPSKNHLVFVQLRTAAAYPYIDHVSFD